MAQIIKFETLRLRREQRSQKQDCYCEAARTARAAFARELEELRREKPKPNVLCLENLESGIPQLSGGWDVIYSVSLFHALPSAAARRVVKTAVDRLAPGGRLLIANLSSEANPQRCPLCRGVGAIQRSELEVIQLAQDVPANTISGQMILPDHSGCNIYLELHKSAATIDQPQLIVLSRREWFTATADSQPA